jgi:hypothetical protein
MSKSGNFHGNAIYDDRLIIAGLDPTIKQDWLD